MWGESVNSIDIAKIAGVSRSTVSRVINNYSNVPIETREKVLEIIKQYNYVPHASARTLAGKSNKIIGLFIIDIKKSQAEFLISESSYFTPFISDIIDISSKKGYHVLVATVNKNKDYNSIQDLFMNKTINGGIFIGVKNDEPEISKLIELNYNVAIIDQEIHSYNDIFSNSIIVNVDNIGGAYDATKYLIELGHKNIAHIGGEKDKLSGTLRYEGFRKAMKDFGVPIRNNLIAFGDFTEESGYKVARKILGKEIPTAIFAANDSMAIGAIKALQEMNLSVPEDISIIGFDDIAVARYMKPALSTVRMAIHQMASIATKNLISSIEENTKVKANYVVPVELVIRDTCSRPDK